jgi:hypothetical protein
MPIELGNFDLLLFSLRKDRYAIPGIGQSFTSAGSEMSSPFTNAALNFSDCGKA